METPRWAQGYAATANAGLRAVASKVPGTVAVAVRWSWRASPGLTLLAGVVQLAAGAVTAFGLLATADVFTQLLAQGCSPPCRGAGPRCAPPG
jgi:ATP-binding cassette subfamily B protein